MRLHMLLAASAFVVLAGALPASAETISRCVLEVDGQSYLDGPCNYSLEEDGSFEIGVGDETEASKYFAYLIKGIGGDDTLGYWNGEEASTHAYADLGAMKQDGACWISRTGKICAYK